MVSLQRQEYLMWKYRITHFLLIQLSVTIYTLLYTKIKKY